MKHLNNIWHHLECISRSSSDCSEAAAGQRFFSSSNRTYERRGELVLDTYCYGPTRCYPGQHRAELQRKKVERVGIAHHLADIRRAYR